MASVSLAAIATASGFVAAAFSLAACSQPEIVVPPAGFAYLSSTDHLLRASMALRGLRPSVDDLRAVNQDPAMLDALVDTYLASPEFGRTMRDLHNEALLLRPDYAFFPAGFSPKPPLDTVDIHDINVSLMEAPLRLVEHVIVNDKPYSEIVTADYTLANGIVKAVWEGIGTYNPSGPEWQVTKWTDARGNAGILSDSWLFTRHSSTPSNANRGRANAISKALLCYDFSSRDIVIDSSVNLADPNAVQNAVVDNDACASCHQALDPLASFFSGYFPVYVPGDITYPMTMYVPNLFELYLGVNMRDPSYFGQAGKSLADLGAMIADDPRFSLCAAKRFYAYFNHIGVEDVPLDTASHYQQVFLHSGMNAKALTKAIVLADDFKASHALTSDAAVDFAGLKKARPNELAAMFEDLTGFHWQVDLTAAGLGRVDLPQDSFLGYQVLGGGIDSVYVTRPSHTDNATSSLFLRAFAEEAASYVVNEDFDQADHNARKLLAGVDSTLFDEALTRKKLAWLHARLFAEFVTEDSEQVNETYLLFLSAFSHGGSVRRAWKATLTAMFQDVRMAYY